MVESLRFPRLAVWVCLPLLVPSSNGRAATPLAADLGSELGRRGAESPPYQNRITPGSTARDRAVERGRAIYWEGTRADGRALTATAGDAGVPLPARFSACVHCHGPDARGKTESDVSASDLRGETLKRSYDVALPSSRRRVPYDATSFSTALTRGIDSSGHALDPRMPRYDLSAAEAADVFAYLDQIANEPNPGVTETEVRIGFSMTKDADGNAATERERQLIAARFDEVNRQGGIFRRRIALVDTTETASSGSNPSVLAVIALENAGASDKSAGKGCTSAESRQRRIPRLHLTACTEENDKSPTFALFPGTVERARALIRYAMTHLTSPPRTLTLLYSSKSISPALVEKITGVARSIATVDATAIDTTSADEMIRELRTAGRECALLVGPPTDFTAFTASAKRVAWEPLLLWTEMPMGQPALARAVCLQPNLPTDATVEARAAYSHSAYAMEANNREGLERDFAIIALANLVVETLKNSGRDLSGERFIAALESAGEIRTGFVPPLLFSAKRHAGSTGLYVVPVPTSSEQVPVEWMAID